MTRLYAIIGILISLSAVVHTPVIAQTLPPWQEGYFDIHHINTGSGNCTFMIFPDGTTLLVDAGDVNRTVRAMGQSPLKIAPRLPHDSLTAAQSMMLYIRKTLPAITAIDYGLVTHFHGDHYGVINAKSKTSEKGNYRLTGITEINEYLPIGTLIDRNYPSYHYPVDIRRHHFDSTTFVNYLGFVNARKISAAFVTESLRVGSRGQIVPKKSHQYDFGVRNIKANGEIWSGTKEGTVSILPDHINAQDYNENPLSIALKISYGKFDYFTGGDMTGIKGNGLPDWFDVETPVGKIVNHVEAMALNHHGVRDATNEDFLRALSPNVIIQQSWSSNHPGEEVLHRMISKDIYPAPRDIFATYVHGETITTYGPWFNAYKSLRGHIVIRVLSPGNEFYVYVLNDSDVNLPIVKSFGPYSSK
jgi:beta-lactamase superfamily II metal-dependent hydrolase